jgi:hypothetical protein
MALATGLARENHQYDGDFSTALLCWHCFMHSEAKQKPNRPPRRLRFANFAGFLWLFFIHGTRAVWVSCRGIHEGLTWQRKMWRQSSFDDNTRADRSSISRTIFLWLWGTKVPSTFVPWRITTIKRGLSHLIILSILQQWIWCYVNQNGDSQTHRPPALLSQLPNIDVRTFVSPWILSWHWKPNGAPSFGSVPRTSPLRG